MKKIIWWVLVTITWLFVIVMYYIYCTSKYADLGIGIALGLLTITGLVGYINYTVKVLDKYIK